MLMVERRPVADDVVSKLGRVDLIGGGMARFWLVIAHVCNDGSIEYRVRRKIVFPVEEVPDAILMASQACAVSLVGSVKRLLPQHLMH